MVLTEEEKKEYLINYKPKPKWYTEFYVFFAVVLFSMFLFFTLKYLGYKNLDNNKFLTLFYANVEGFIFFYIIKHVMQKLKK